MNEPKAFKQPQRAPADIQASALAQVRFTAPAETDEEPDEETAVVTPTRFQIDGALRSLTLTDESTEYCIEVMDESSERVWEIAVWPSPPDSDISLSHCLVVGSKNDARELLRNLTGAAAFVSTATQANGRQQGQRGYRSAVAQKPGRTQQKQG